MYTEHLAGNITDDTAIDKLFAEAEKKFGALDVLVNCAGMMDKFDPAGQLERGWWDRVIALNLTAPTMMTQVRRSSIIHDRYTSRGCNVHLGVCMANMLTWNQRAVNAMLKAGKKGSIVNIASIAGFRGFTSGMLTYSA